MSHVKAGGATRQASPRPGNRRGIKKYGGEKVATGNIIIRQKGTKYVSGINTKYGSDYTIYAVSEGKVAFKQKRGKLTVNVV